MNKKKILIIILAFMSWLFGIFIYLYPILLYTPVIASDSLFLFVGSVWSILIIFFGLFIPMNLIDLYFKIK